MADYRTFQVKLNTEKDASRIAWLERQTNITEAIRVLIDNATIGNAPGVPASGAVDLDLGAIRCVFEAVLDERLAGLALADGRNEGDGGEYQEDIELASKLDAMF